MGISEVRMGARASGKHRWPERQDIHCVGCLRADQVLLTKQAGSRLVLGSQIAERAKSSTCCRPPPSDFDVARIRGFFEAPVGRGPRTASIASLSRRTGPIVNGKPQAKAFRIGVLSPGCHPPTANLDLLLQGLRDLGYAEGENLAIEWRYSEGRAERFPELAAELARFPVDLIVAVSTPAALAAKAAT